MCSSIVCVSQVLTQLCDDECVRAQLDTIVKCRKHPPSMGDKSPGKAEKTESGTPKEGKGRVTKRGKRD